MALDAAFSKLLLLARRVREQQRRQRGPKVYSLHAPEVECIGKGKAHRPKFGVATTLKHCKGGQFVTHVKALPRNPYDGHTLATVPPDMEALVGSTIARILAWRRPSKAAFSALWEFRSCPLDGGTIQAASLEIKSRVIARIRSVDVKSQNTFY